jgi:oligopeptide/dipeptide ABC transporter ATP-binding protein
MTETDLAATPAAAGAGEPLLEVRDLVKHFPLGGRGLFARADGVVRAVDGVSLDVFPRETLALVGESGCGKTTLARTAALLLPPTAGSVRYRGEELTRLSRARLRPYRRRIQMMFQDPFGSLDPRMRVSAIVAEPLDIHRLGSRPERRARVAELLSAVGLSPADGTRFPHEFSGGQRQRIALARALAPRPDLIIADEPVSALDVSIQSQVLNLMKELKERFGLSLLFIGHDLAVVDHIADRIAVMYLGRIVEIGGRDAVTGSPRHPYTRALLSAVPEATRARPQKAKAREPRVPEAEGVAGDVPSALNPPSGCPFHPRCPFAQDICREALPPLEPVQEGEKGARAPHLAACHFKDDLPGFEVRP